MLMTAIGATESLKYKLVYDTFRETSSEVVYRHISSLYQQLSRICEETSPPIFYKQAQIDGCHRSI